MANLPVYKVVVVGTGKRGMHHAAVFKNNPRFRLEGLCDRDSARLAKAASELGVSLTSDDPEALSSKVKPDVFCFCTPPTVRLELIRAGIKSGAKLIAYEKPMALSMNEAIEIRKAVEGAGVKTVVSHQHRYGPHYRKVKEIVDSGAIGRAHTVYSTAAGWMLHMMTHMIDYMRWYNGNAPAEWVMGAAAGRAKLKDNHPSPDYVAGFIQFSNGVRGIAECGAGAPDVPEVEYWWRKNRVGAQGTEGFAEALTGGGWRAVTREGFASGEGSMDYNQDMPPYVEDICRWLDDDKAIHPCNGASAYQGFEIMMAILRSVVQRGQVALPLGPGDPEIDAIAKVLPETKVLASTEANQKAYES
ncbi:MAG: Gfo/Idh/MocA family oxidoreductase [Acidobacteriota bacterium]|nr:Gfo/Idh/MocA family oxidoreductase [Acidobacteriota bacterium]